MSCRQELSSRNQGFNRAPGSWKSHFGIGSRSENSMNGMTPPLYLFPLAFQPINEASCKPPSPQPKQGVFASHVGGGGNGDCQSLADIPCNVVGGALSIQVAIVVLTSLKPEISPLKLWPKWHLRLMLLLYKSHGNCRGPRFVLPTTDPKKDCTMLGKGKAATIR